MMTRTEFLEDVTEFSELREFANEYDIWRPVEDLVDDDDIDREVDDAISEMAGREEWRYIKECLDQVPDYAGWFLRDGYLDFVDATEEDFDRIKQEILEYADDRDVWDAEDEDDDYYEDTDADGADDGSDEDSAEECGELDSDVVMAELFGIEAVPA